MRLSEFGRTVVVAPHPDDETLGCGATLLRLKAESAAPLIWILMTRMVEGYGYAPETIALREREIAAVSEIFKFDRLVQLPFAAATLDSQPTNELVKTMAKVFDEVQPETILAPFPGDAHSDHARTFNIVSACSKWFRRRNLSRIMCYEVPSETGFNLNPTAPVFSPNCYVKVEPALITKKIETMGVYCSEMSEFPFPRSKEAIRALSEIRGSECGAVAAEAFMLVRESF